MWKTSLLGKEILSGGYIGTFDYDMLNMILIFVTQLLWNISIIIMMITIIIIIIIIILK